MWIILDVIVVSIILIYALISAKRGFVRTAIELIGFGFAVYLSFTLSSMVAEGVYTSMVQPAIVDTVVDTVGDTAASSIDKAVDAAFEKMPKFVVKSADNLGVTSQKVKNDITSNTVNNNSIQNIAITISDSVVKPVVVPLIKAIVGFILFVILLFVVKLLARIVNKAFSIPLIGGINKTLGGVLGAAKGIIIAGVVCIVISTIVSFTKNGILIFTQENIEKTYIFKLFTGFSLFK